MRANKGCRMPAVTDPLVAFTEVEAKLLRLALCDAAGTGEIDGAARALIASWRKRGLLAHELLDAVSAEPVVVERWRTPAFSAGDFVMPFGKCRGIPLRSIKRAYLHWVLSNCEDIQPELKRAINAVLYGH